MRLGRESALSRGHVPPHSSPEKWHTFPALPEPAQTARSPAQPDGWTSSFGPPAQQTAAPQDPSCVCKRIPLTQRRVKDAYGLEITARAAPHARHTVHTQSGGVKSLETSTSVRTARRIPIDRHKFTTISAISTAVMDEVPPQMPTKIVTQRDTKRREFPASSKPMPNSVASRQRQHGTLMTGWPKLSSSDVERLHRS